MLGAVGDRIREIGDSWRALSIYTRRRVAAAVGVVAVVLLSAGLVVPNLPCSFPGGDECAPGDDAIALVPAGADAYVHANLDPGTEQAGLAMDVASRMPQVSRQVIGQAAALLGAGAPIAAASEAWFGGEAAVAVVGGGDGDRVELLETTDESAAMRFAESLAAGVPEASDYRDVEVSEDARGGASAVVGDFLVLGPAEGVQAVIDVETGAEGADSLAEDPVAEEALDALPEHRVAEAYLSADGIEALVADPRGALASFEPLIDSAASRGAAVAVSAGDEGFGLAVRSVLDPDRGGSEAGFFEAFDDFEPGLPEELPNDALAYLGLGSPSDTVAALVRQATARAPGVAAGFTDLIEDLRGAADVDIQRDLLEALGGEAAFAVVPRADVDADAELLPPEATPAPYLEFVADDVDEERAREALARLQKPIAESLDPELGAPSFQQQEIGGVEAQVLRVSPVAQLVYAIFDSKLVIANEEAAIEEVAEGDDPLADSDRYRDTVDDLPDEPALIAYLDVRGLLAFAERAGLAEDPAYTAFAPDLRRLGSVGLAVTRDDDRLAVDASLLVD
jgi:hypothetical protein